MAGMSPSRRGPVTSPPPVGGIAAAAHARGKWLTISFRFINMPPDVEGRCEPARAAAQSSAAALPSGGVAR